LAWTLYADALQGAFGFQDEAIVLGNTDTQAAPFAALLFHDYSGQKLGGPSSVYGWRPLSVLSFRLNFAVSGHQPFAFKATNICLHAMAACLVYLCSLSLMKDCIPWRSAAAPHALVHAYSLAAGLLFCAHPIHTEAVAGVSGRSDVLWVVFLLPAFLLYRAATAATLQTFDSRQHELGNTADARSSFSGVWPPLLGAAAFFGLALLSNEKAILGTLLFAANDGVWWRRHRGARADMVTARAATSAGPAAAASKLRGHGKTQAHSDAEAWRVYGPGSSGQAARDDDKIAVCQTAWYPTRHGIPCDMICAGRGRRLRRGRADQGVERTADRNRHGLHRLHLVLLAGALSLRDVAGVSPVPVRMWPGEPSPGAAVTGASPVPVQMWQG
jgi:hypothetical protein